MIEGKIIRCCAECSYYNKKRHLCNLGHNREDNPRDHFYDDCTSLEDLTAHDARVRTETINECLQVLHNIYAQNEYCSNGCDDDGVGCDDCMYTYIAASISKLKENNNG